MAKGEVELKKIELKVSVDCCDGCKRKVNKVLRNIEGIQKAELDPLQPKVTIIGNVEPQSIVKKLLKVGKQAEILSNQTQTTEKANDAEMPFIATEQHISTKSKYLHEQETYPAKKASHKKASHKKTPKDASSTGEMCFPPEPETTFTVYKSVQHDNSREVNTEAIPYYAIHSYQSSPLTQKCWGHEYCCCDQTNREMFYQPPVPIPDSNIGDYFSDENTSGCHVM